MEIAPGIHNVITEPEPVMGVTNTYLIVGRTGAVWVDTGWDRPGEGQARVDYWKKLGSPPLRGIAVTHRHPPHWGNAPLIQRECGGPPIIATYQEADAINERLKIARVDRPVRDGETLSLGDKTLQFVFAPGHTYGTMAVFIQESRSLFPGDAIMGVGTSVVNPGEGEIALFLDTMQKFLRMNPSVIYTGQGPVVTDPRAKINELIQHRRQREEEVLSQLRTGPKTVEQMFGAIYSGLNERLSNLAKNQIKSHLIKLQNEGRVVADGETYWLK
ncbi:MAG: MBL fold metallo-hydrolase [Chloroflexi bacterium]|nr:MBL fold metallo-hydrolase [Chloroflexota bacterium]